MKETEPGARNANRPKDQDSCRCHTDGKVWYEGTGLGRRRKARPEASEKLLVQRKCTSKTGDNLIMYVIVPAWGFPNSGWSSPCHFFLREVMDRAYCLSIDAKNQRSKCQVWRDRFPPPFRAPKVYGTPHHFRTSLLSRLSLLSNRYMAVLDEPKQDGSSTWAL